MAIKHRKLFPETNQTASCLDFCDSSCPYDCYVYAEPWISPPPPSGSSPPPTIYTPDEDDSPTISPYVIITIGLLAGFFILVSSYAIIVKYSSVWRRRSHPPHDSESDDEEFLDQNRGPEIDHPVWYIATVGLQQAIINSITVCRYKRGEGLIEGTECSVCLSEFREDETLRLLPKCNHAFHIPCIDTWLRSHTNCPLCRARIVSVAVDIVNPPPAEPSDRRSRRFGPSQQTQIEVNSGDDTESGSSNGGPNQQRSTAAGGELQILDGNGGASKEGVNTNGDSGDDRVVDDSDQILPVRRSVSVNSSSSSSVGSDEFKVNWVHRRMDGVKLRSSSKSIAQCLHKTPVSMKRSFSCGGRFFLPRRT